MPRTSPLLFAALLFSAFLLARPLLSKLSDKNILAPLYERGGHAVVVPSDIVSAPTQPPSQAIFPKTYIVTLRDSADASKVKAYIEKQGGTILDEFPLIKGFSVSFKEESQLLAIKSMYSDVINHIEEDTEMHAMKS